MKKNYRTRENLNDIPDWLRKRRCPRKKLYLSGKRILPPGINGNEKLTELMNETFLAYNSARLRQACELFVTKMLKPKAIVGMSLAGALTPAGLGCSCITD